MTLKPGDLVRTPMGLPAVVVARRADSRIEVQYLGKTPTDGLHGDQRPQDCRTAVLHECLLRDA